LRALIADSMCERLANGRDGGFEEIKTQRVTHVVGPHGEGERRSASEARRAGKRE
jgi:hypothetical protein